jgi:hypothetical protein
MRRLAASSLLALVAACSNSSSSADLGADMTAGNACTLAAGTTATSTVTANCAKLDRDVSACDASRKALGLSGYWLKFSCRATLTVAGGAVQIQADGQPDYASNYFATTSPCYTPANGTVTNPNRIAVKALTMTMPATPNDAEQMMMGAIVGIALNGVPIFANFAAPGDDIFTEAMTFDSCQGHPQMAGQYHYHSEPYSISADDSAFIGVLRDGYPLYGRRDSDGSLPALDLAGGHTGITVDSVTPVYHHHVNEQTSTNAGTAGQKQWFLTTGRYHGTPGTCTGC